MPTSTPQPEPSFENLEPLLAQSWFDGPNTAYLFRCPVTGAEATGFAPTPQFAGSPFAKSAIKRAPGDAAWAERTTVEDVADRIVPGGDLITSIAGDFLRGRRSRKARKQTEADGAAQQEAIRQMLVTAFRPVADQFTWDAAGGRWVSVGAPRS